MDKLTLEAAHAAAVGLLDAEGAGDVATMLESADIYSMPGFPDSGDEDVLFVYLLSDTPASLNRWYRLIFDALLAALPPQEVGDATVALIIQSTPDPEEDDDPMGDLSHDEIVALLADDEPLPSRQGQKAPVASNQGRVIRDGKTHLWENLVFRSKTETRIAAALERAGVMFFPNCRARISQAGGRGTLEPDFLICVHGRWGILEVDGEPFHLPTRTVHDHRRDRFFLHQGIRLVQHYDASECYERPDDVVAEFLELLQQAYT